MPTLNDLTVTFDERDDLTVGTFVGYNGRCEVRVVTSSATVYFTEDHFLALFNELGKHLFRSFEIEAFDDAHGHNVSLRTTPLLDEDVHVTLNGEVLFKGEVTR